MSGHTVKLNTQRGHAIRLHADKTGEREVFLHISTELASMCFCLAAEDMRAFTHVITMAMDEALMQREETE